ncbi:MAG: Fic family protein [Desulfobacter postgatei]|uniref:Fic family protein n=1 Tax=Desulfobacter postgatei TaxID=2293 RepID=UPI0023F16E0A|nr:Fic family protein [Desulfobacter postgatei]MDD4272504.1 Fic family protein [Desulfobacter postgatei]
MLYFLENLDKDLQTALITQLRNLWTHTSTAIEGNTLTLGETAFVLEEGLTVSGKPLKDHEEVVGHARAIDLIYGLLEKGTPLTQDALFNLHKAVQTHVILDVYKPVGAWKKEPNSTVGVIDEKQVVFEYAAPQDVPSLMEQWFKLYHELMASAVPGDKEKALQAYVALHVSFVRIHPFFDGNGRMARLVANLPVLKAGLPPIIVPREQRKAYIDALSQYHYAVGQIEQGKELLPEADALKPFTAFCEEAWKATIDLVNEIHKKQQIRAGKKR